MLRIDRTPAARLPAGAARRPAGARGAALRAPQPAAARALHRLHRDRHVRVQLRRVAAEARRRPVRRQGAVRLAAGGHQRRQPDRLADDGGCAASARSGSSARRSCWASAGSASRGRRTSGSPTCSASRWVPAAPRSSPSLNAHLAARVPARHARPAPGARRRGVPRHHSDRCADHRLDRRQHQRRVEPGLRQRDRAACASRSAAVARRRSVARDVPAGEHLLDRAR